MSESIFIRVQRVLSSGTNEAVGALERVSGGGLMRQAIREADQAVDDVRGKLENANARRGQAARQQEIVRADIATLEGQAKFALDKGREDLAEAAVARQIDYEGELERLRASQAEATAEARRLEACLAELKVRRSQMEKELSAFQAASGAGASSAGAPVAPEDRARRRAERAEAAFNRAKAAAGGVSLGLADADSAAKLAEVDALQRDSKIADRLAAFRAARARNAPATEAKKPTASAKKAAAGSKRPGTAPR